jgi:hypothetical protein
MIPAFAVASATVYFAFPVGSAIEAPQHPRHYREVNRPQPVVALPVATSTTVVDLSDVRSVRPLPFGLTNDEDLGSPDRLIRSIQVELKRIGCQINVTGEWDGLTRLGAREMLRIDNSAIPTDKPDIAILMLLRSRATAECVDAKSAPSTIVKSARAEVDASNTVSLNRQGMKRPLSAASRVSKLPTERVRASKEIQSPFGNGQLGQ